MGVGYPLDILVCVALGVDMFDCVFPTRTARFGVGLVPEGDVRIKNSEYCDDPRPVEEGCPCECCEGYSRAHLHFLFKSQREGEATVAQLLTMHNISFMLRFVGQLRSHILEGSFESFAHNFLTTRFPSKALPSWVKEALEAAGLAMDAFTSLPEEEGSDA